MPVKADKKLLVVRERLCCEEGNLRYRQCDGEEGEESSEEVDPDSVCNEFE